MYRETWLQHLSYADDPIQKCENAILRKFKKIKGNDNFISLDQ